MFRMFLEQTVILHSVNILLLIRVSGSRGISERLTTVPHAITLLYTKTWGFITFVFFPSAKFSVG